MKINKNPFKKKQKQLTGLAKWEALAAQEEAMAKVAGDVEEETSRKIKVKGLAETSRDTVEKKDKKKKKSRKGAESGSMDELTPRGNQQLSPTRNKSLKELQSHAKKAISALNDETINGSWSGSFSNSKSGSASGDGGGSSGSSGSSSGSSEDSAKRKKDCLLEVTDDGIPGLRAGTIERILEWMVFTGDMQHARCFLYTYRAYTTPEELWRVFVALYESVQNNHRYSSTKKNTLMKRIVEILKTWVEDSLYVDFKPDKALMKLLTEFVAEMPEEHKNEFKLLFMRKKPKAVIPSMYVLPNTQYQPWRKLWPPTEFAQQMTLQVCEYFKGIQPSELLNQNWQRADKEKVAPTLTLLGDKFNETAFWVATEIVTCPLLQGQVEFIKAFITILDRLIGMNNFFSLTAIMSGLGNTAVQRLDKVWAQVPEKYRVALERLEDLMSPTHNFANYRNMLKNLTLHAKDDIPIVPYLVVYLKDLTFINDGNPDYLEGPEKRKLPNFDKMKLIGQQILELKGYQRAKTYEYPVNSSAQMFLTKLHFLEEDALYQKSCELKPLFGSPRDEGEDEEPEEVTFTNPLLQFKSPRRDTENEDEEHCEKNNHEKEKKDSNNSKKKEQKDKKKKKKKQEKK